MIKLFIPCVSIQSVAYFGCCHACTTGVVMVLYLVLPGMHLQVWSLLFSPLACVYVFGIIF